MRSQATPKTMKVFLVADSSILRLHMRGMILQLGGAEIVGEADAAVEAIDAIRMTKPHIVLLDIRLRAGTGLDVLQEIKRDSADSTIAIVITNYPYEQYRRLSLALGADYFFHKATQSAQLADVLKTYIPGAVTETDNDRETKKSHTGLQALRGSETVLVVEDEEMLRVVLASTLGDLGYHVVTAEDGEEALEVFRGSAGEIDVVLTDMGLPKRSGIEIFMRMKSLKPDVNVILMSGYLEQDTRTSLLRAGVRQVLEKPFDDEDVAKAVRQSIDGVMKQPVSIAWC